MSYRLPLCHATQDSNGIRCSHQAIRRYNYQYCGVHKNWYRSSVISDDKYDDEDDEEYNDDDDDDEEEDEYLQVLEESRRESIRREQRPIDNRDRRLLNSIQSQFSETVLRACERELQRNRQRDSGLHIHFHR